LFGTGNSLEHIYLYHTLHNDTNTLITREFTNFTNFRLLIVKNIVLFIDLFCLIHLSKHDKKNLHKTLQTQLKIEYHESHRKP
jgi:hypothetical protein